MRNVPCTQLTTEKSPRGVGTRNSTTSSPIRKRGTPETYEVKLPTLPPSRRTFTRDCAEPFQVSVGSSAVNVQISPASHALLFSTQRARMIRRDDCVSFATDICARVVGEAALQSSSETQSTDTKQRRDSTVNFIFIAPQSSR